MIFRNKIHAHSHIEDSNNPLCPIMTYLSPFANYQNFVFLMHYDAANDSDVSVLLQITKSKYNIGSIVIKIFDRA